jgi:hypothetical protein
MRQFRHLSTAVVLVGSLAGGLVLEGASAPARPAAAGGEFNPFRKDGGDWDGKKKNKKKDRKDRDEREERDGHGDRGERSESWDETSRRELRGYEESLREKERIIDRLIAGDRPVQARLEKANELSSSLERQSERCGEWRREAQRRGSDLAASFGDLVRRQGAALRRLEDLKRSLR